jgi:serine/threonine protein kinase
VKKRVGEPVIPMTFKLDAFTFKTTLGKGAYAIVKLAIHKPTGSVFAIKSYDKFRLTDPARKRAVQSEIKVLKQLDHPNIIKYRSYISTQKQLHIICDYILGQSL